MKFLLAKVSRPDFDDDLDDWVKPLFHLVEDIDYPNTVLILDNHSLYVEWTEFDGAVGTLFRQFKQCGLELDKAWQYADSGDFKDRPDNPATLQALRQI